MVHTIPADKKNALDPDKSYICDCGMSFETASELNKHNQDKHGQGAAELTPPAA